MQRVELRSLRGARGHDQLAAAAVGDSTLSAIGIQRIAAFNAQARLERAARVVEPGVDDFTVARADAGADGRLALQHDGLEAAQGQRTRHRQADDAGPHHHRIHLVHRMHSARLDASVCTRAANGGRRLGAHRAAPRAPSPLRASERRGLDPSQAGAPQRRPSSRSAFAVAARCTGSNATPASRAAVSEACQRLGPRRATVFISAP